MHIDLRVYCVKCLGSVPPCCCSIDKAWPFQAAFRGQCLTPPTRQLPYQFNTFYPTTQADQDKGRKQDKKQSLTSTHVLWDDNTWRGTHESNTQNRRRLAVDCYALVFTAIQAVQFGNFPHVEAIVRHVSAGDQLVQRGSLLPKHMKQCIQGLNIFMKY